MLQSSLRGIAIISRCACGARKRRDAQRCTACEQRSKEEMYAEAARIVATGKCPRCGLPLERNSALPGWWQCAAYGVASFRKPAHRDAAACAFQIFTRS